MAVSGKSDRIDGTCEAHRSISSNGTIHRQFPPGKSFYEPPGGSIARCSQVLGKIGNCPLDIEICCGIAQ